MIHSFQMQTAVDKEVKDAKFLNFVQIYKNFSGILREREAQDICCFISISIIVIETSREGIRAKN